MIKYNQQKERELTEQYTTLLSSSQHQSAYQLLKHRLRIRKQTTELTLVDYSELCELANYIAMHSLKESQYDKCIEYLRKAEKYCKYSSYLTLVTYNNWGCYYKKCNNHSLALLYINKAIKIAQTIKFQIIDQKNYQKIKFLADCYLNLCAILSNMNQHELALQNAQMAINYIQNELFQFQAQYKEDPKLIDDRHNVLVIAKYNQAVELEYLKRWGDAKQAYTSLKQYIAIHFENNHSLLKTINKALLEIQFKHYRRRSSSKCDMQNVNLTALTVNRKNSVLLPTVKSHYKLTEDDVQKRKMSRKRLRSNLTEIQNL